MDRVEEQQSLVRVPAHLKQFVVDQEYERYTPIDQAVWRYVMRQNSNFLGSRAHRAYLEGLAASGISIEKIPNVSEMNAALAKIGWGAVTIDGFIPAVAFFDFQAHGILPIACDMRTIDHIAYTPAPDIIHEAAGHSPIILDDKYRDYLKIFGEIGSKAISSKEDYEVYEAIRYLSIVKEDPSASEEEVRLAERSLEEKVAAVTEVSEAAMLSRLYWWTVEYGLIGDVDNPQIYGAGLLSSVGESMSCLQEDVIKLPFTLDDCIQTDFDITKPQPQLFVCQNFEELIRAIQTFEKRMAVSIGGTDSLIKGVKSGQTTTSVYSSGLQVSGQLSDLVFDDQGEAIYLKTTGPTALSVGNQQLMGHGKETHPEGFGSPIGKVKGLSISLEEAADDDLDALGLVVGQKTKLVFESGIDVSGLVRYIQKEQDKIVLIGFEDCQVQYGSAQLFQAHWGVYDMAVGASIVSVFAGAADRERFVIGTHQPSETKRKRPVYTMDQLILHDLYQQIRDLRENKVDPRELEQKLSACLDILDHSFTVDWLLRLEILDLLQVGSLRSDLQEKLVIKLNQLKENPSVTQLIDNGLALLGQS